MKLSAHYQDHWKYWHKHRPRYIGSRGLWEVELELESTEGIYVEVGEVGE